jgi:hypothetical protein
MCVDKENFMKSFLTLLTMLCLSFTTAQAQESVSANQQINSLREIQNQIDDLEVNIQSLETYVDDVIACGDMTPAQHFNGTTCVTIAERDPNIRAHGTQNLSATSCSATDEAQQFSGASWSCKTLN